jgi:hypothetical protein
VAAAFRTTMSRGLGKLQRDILGSLEAAKSAVPSYCGCEWEPAGESGWVRVYGAKVRIADDVFDLRAVSKFLATNMHKVHRGGVGIHPRFEASVSRAVRGLVRDGYLKQLSLLPVSAVYEDPHHRVEHLADGSYVILRERQVRFVKKMQTSIALTADEK